MPTSSPTPDRIVREAEQKARSGLSRMTRHRMAENGDFPKKRRISPGVSGVLESEFSAWLASRSIIAAPQRKPNRNEAEQPQAAA